jgi:hypothetical protein
MKEEKNCLDCVNSLTPNVPKKIMSYSIKPKVPQMERLFLAVI